MNIKEKYRIKALLRRVRIASGKRYMKKTDRQAVIKGYQALKKLGIYNNPKWVCDRKPT